MSLSRFEAFSDGVFAIAFGCPDLSKIQSNGWFRRSDLCLRHAKRWSYWMESLLPLMGASFQQ
jgi:hypothetical protein